MFGEFCAFLAVKGVSLWIHFAQGDSQVLACDFLISVINLVPTSFKFPVEIWNYLVSLALNQTMHLW